MIKKLFSKKEVTRVDIILLSLYTLALLGASLVVKLFGETDKAREILSAFAVCTPFFLYLFMYQSLRNWYVFLYMLVLCLYQIGLGYYLEANYDLLSPRGVHAAHYLKFNVVFLLLFNGLRYASLLLQKKELVAPVYGGFSHSLFDNRKITVVDMVLYFGYVFVWACISYS